jgi:hypothetical protein
MRKDAAGAILLAAAFAVRAGPAHAADAPNWEVVRDAGCVARSAAVALNDGYQTIEARIVVDRSKVVVESPSDLDPGFHDSGLKLRDRDLIHVERVEGRKRAVFESAYGEIVSAFKAGREVEARLRFWPEFPVTGVHGARFSLMGFTKAYGEAMACK